MTIADVSVQPKGFNRRQALKVVAAVAAIPAGVAGFRLLGPAARFHTWEGDALGAMSSMMIWHPNAMLAERTIARMVTEVRRLEEVFSLARPDSELSQLNLNGRIDRASTDLVTVLTASRGLGAATGGSFDPTVQPLWDVYGTYFNGPEATADGPPAEIIDNTRRLVDYRGIEITGRTIRFDRWGMQATLNGIAQGYITDRIADLLRNEGFEHVVVELGESRVIGDHPDGRPWRVALRDQLGATNRMVELSNGSLAVHGGYGTTFDASGRNHHIFDPATGRSAMLVKEVVVFSPRAMDADGIGVALFVAGEERAAGILANYPGVRALITRLDGTTVTIG
jgi:thiamine biosynthesis lipoprotein